MLRKERTQQEYQQTLEKQLKEEINRMSQIRWRPPTPFKADTGQSELNKGDINLTEMLSEVVRSNDMLAGPRGLISLRRATIIYAYFWGCFAN